jgi:CRP-like cAMP-binding protein
MQQKVFKQNEVIFWEGSTGRCMYKIIEGTVNVFLGYGTKNETKLTQLGEGRIFGEMAVLEAWTRSATIVAADDNVTILEISAEELSDYFKNDPEQIKTFMKNLSQRLRELTDDYKEVCNTISEMHRTRGEIENRKEGLLSKINKFLKDYNRFFNYTQTLEAMETYEEIEQAREDRGETRENLHFMKDQVIFREGDAGDCMYYIGGGAVGIYTDYGTDHEILLTELNENQFFGEMGLIEKLPRSATAVVLENDTALVRLTEEGLDQMFAERPAIILLAMQHLSSRLRRLTKEYTKACQMVSKMNNEENGKGELTMNDEDAIKYYVGLAQAKTHRWMYF